MRELNKGGGTILKNDTNDTTFVLHGQVGIMGLVINVVMGRIRSPSSLNIDVPRFG